MNFDALIEKVAFGKAPLKLSSCLGMYISPEVIYLSEVRFSGGRPVVDHLIRIPIPATGKAGETSRATMSLNTDFLLDSAKIQTLVRQAMSQIRWNSKEVVVTLSHHLGLMRYFTMPAIERRFLKSAVPVEAKKYIPIPFDALSQDFQTIDLPPGPDGKPRLGALMAVSPSKNLPSIQNFLSGLGLTMVGMELAPCSVLRLWHALDSGNPPEPFGQIHFDGGNVRIMISDKGLPVFFREVFLGAEASAGDSRKVDIGGCLNFSQKQLGVAKLKTFRVSGACAEINAWKEVVAQESGCPAVTSDTAALLGINGGDWGGYAALGAALRHLSPTRLVTDLLVTDKIGEDEKRVARDILVLGFLAVGVIIGMGFLQQSRYQWLARELKNYKRDAALELVFGGKSSTDIQNMLQSMSTTASLLYVMDPESQVKMSDVLNDIAEALPEKMWLTRISISNPIEAREMINKKLELEGHATGPSMTEEQNMAFQFRDNLQRAPVLSKMFPNLQISVAGKPVSASQQESASGTNYKRLLEKRTVFTITGKDKAK